MSNTNLRLSNLFRRMCAQECPYKGCYKYLVHVHMYRLRKSPSESIFCILQTSASSLKCCCLYMKQSKCLGDFVQAFRLELWKSWWVSKLPGMYCADTYQQIHSKCSCDLWALEHFLQTEERHFARCYPDLGIDWEWRTTSWEGQHLSWFALRFTFYLHQNWERE